MRLVENPHELKELLALLPTGLKAAEPDWAAVRESCFELRADFLYVDVVLPHNMQHLPSILQHLGEPKCFVFNHKSLLTGMMTDGSDIAFEISATDHSATILHELSNSGALHHRYLSVFYFVGDCGIISSEGDWFVFARTDDLAIFTASTELQYSEFNEHWWPSRVRAGSRQP